MANVEKGWLYNRNGNQFAPATLIENVYTRNGVSYDERVRSYIASIQRVNGTDIAALKAITESHETRVTTLEDKTASLGNIDINDSDILYIIDGSGNVIMYIDEKGIHSIDLITKSYGSMSSLTADIAALQVQIDSLNSDISDIVNNIDAGDSDTFYVIDKNENVIAYIDQDGVHSINIASKNYNLEDLGNMADILSKNFEEEISNRDAIDANQDVEIVNIKKKINYVTDAISGKYFTVVNANGATIGYFDNEGFHANKVYSKSYEMETDIGNLYTKAESLQQEIEQVNTNLNAEIANTNNNLQSLEDDLRQHLDWGDSDTFYIIDDKEQVVAYINGTGLHVIDLYIGTGNDEFNIFTRLSEIDNSISELRRDTSDADASVKIRLESLEEKTNYVKGPDQEKLLTVVNSNGVSIGTFTNTGFQATKVASNRYDLDTTIDDLKNQDIDLQTNITQTNQKIDGVKLELSSNIATNADNFSQFKNNLNNHIDWEDSDTLYIIDTQERVIAYVDADGIHVTNLYFSNTDIISRFEQVDEDIALESKDRQTQEAAINATLEAHINQFVNYKNDQTTLNNQQDARMQNLETNYTALKNEVNKNKTEVNESIADLDAKIIPIEAKLKDVTTVMDFVGAINPNNVSGYQKGDVGVSGDKEYVFYDGAWHEFGNVSAESAAITALQKIIEEHSKDIAKNDENIANVQVRLDGIEAVFNYEDQDDTLFIIDNNNNVIARFHRDYGLQVADLYVGDEQVMSYIQNIANNIEQKIQDTKLVLDTKDAALEQNIATLNNLFNNYKTTQADIDTNQDSRLSALERKDSELDEKDIQLSNEIAEAKAVDLIVNLASGDKGNINNPSIGVTGILPVSHGGTGLASIAANSLICGNGINSLQSIPNGSENTLLVSSGINAIPSFKTIRIDNALGTMEHTINLCLDSVTISSIAIPAANENNAGLITVAEQTFAGQKTFRDDLFMANSNIDMGGGAIKDISNMSTTGDAYYFVDDNDNVVVYVNNKGISATDLFYKDKYDDLMSVSNKFTELDSSIKDLQAADSSLLITLNSNVKTLEDTISGRVMREGDVMAGPLATSFKSAIAVGSYQADATTIPDLVQEVRYSSGCMGSVNIDTSYSVDNDSISSGWYNFIYTPHRSGGLNGNAAGDNTEYGTLLLYPMTSSVGSWRIRVSMGEISEVARLFDTSCWNSAMSSLSWSTNTQSGPTLNLTMAGISKTATIPSASESSSGIVTTNEQVFAGSKTFDSSIYFNSRVVLRSESYGTSLPSSGEEGQIFFLLIE